MSDTKNLFLALALSMLVLLGWTWVEERYFPQPKSPAPDAQSEAPGEAPGTPAAPVAPSTDQAPAAPDAVQAAKLRDRNLVLASGPRVKIETPSMVGSINLKGAQFDDLKLKDHQQAGKDNAPPVRLLSPLGARGATVAAFGWAGQGVPTPGLDTMWTADRDTLSDKQPVTLTATLGAITYTQVISADDGYLFTVKQTVTNAGATPANLRPNGLVSRAGRSRDPGTWTQHVGPVGVFDGKADYGVGWKELNAAGPKGVAYNNVTGWLGFGDKYWLTALAPQDARMTADFRASPSGGYQADYLLAPQVIAPGQSKSVTTNLFAGAKEKRFLDRYESEGITKFTKAIDWGWFEWFMRPIFALLLFLFHLTGNFGFAIIGLTLIVRLIMFPIAQKQFASMAAMRKIQPKLKAIQERFKEDKPRQQQEILKLYQTEKINPAAGCLPILLQIPVFYALYKVLSVSVEMRHQPFILWIHDLSAPDPLTPVNLFGLLAFTPPAFLAIGVLPILVGFTQWLTMKLNPQPMDPTQQAIFSIMPWMLVFVMAPFAAGLQLYWMTNNLLTIAQQSWLYRRFGLHLSDTHPVET